MKPRIFFFMREESVSQSENESKGSNTSNLYSANRSAKSGAQPAKLSGTSDRERTNEHAKALAHDTESILCHLLNQAKKADPRKTGETSRALCPANWLTKSTASELHRPPVSNPTTTN